MSRLSRYLDPEILGIIADQSFDPQGIVLGNLAGLHKSKQAGFAVEFQGHREYVPGDDPKHIDWRVYYRHEKYFVKQFEMETNLVCHLVLDISASMRYGEGNRQKLQYAAQAAATLAYCILRQNDKVSLTTIDRAVQGFLPPSNSWEQILKMTQHLGEIEAREETDLAGGLMDLAGRLGRREIVVIFSDFFTDTTELEQAVQRLRLSKHEVVLFHVLDRDELTFPFRGMTKFVGLEIPDPLLVDTDELRRRYLLVLNRFTQQLDNIVQRNGAERFLVDTSRRVDEVLIDYLHQRQAAVRSRLHPRVRHQWLPTRKVQD
jgi:uncharacterized protein (DUF58 family)